MPSVRASLSKACHRCVIAAFQVVDAASVFPIAVFRTDTGIIEASAHGMHVAGLTVLVLHDVAVAAVQHTGTAVRSAAMRDRPVGFPARPLRHRPNGLRRLR